MSKRKRQRMFSREQRAANRAAIEAEERALGPEEVQRRADVALVTMFFGRAAVDVSSLELAETFLTLDEGERDMAPVIARQYEWKTGDGLTPFSAQARLDEEEDRRDAECEREWLEAQWGMTP